MAAASYTTDLALIHACDAASASWTEPTGFADGAITLPETDYFINGTGCLSKNMGASASANSGAIYNAGSGLTIPSGSAVMMWIYFGAPNAISTQANGGLRVIVGSGTAAFKQWYVRGSDTYTYGGWVCVPVDPNTTQDATTGSPTATLQYFGATSTLSGAGAVSKGNPFGLDVVRYGRCEMRINGGDLANGYATFAGFSTQNDSQSNRWGLFQSIAGGYLWQGLMVLGYSSAVDFRDENVSIQIANTQKVAAAFNKIEIRNAASRVDWTGVSITALGTVSKGQLQVVDNADVNILNCTFTAMDTFAFLGASTITDSVFRRCGIVTVGGAAFSGCTFDDPSGTTAVSTTALSTLSDCVFNSDGTGHAVDLGTVAASTTMTWDCNDAGYAATNGSTGNETIKVSVSANQTLTINVGAGKSTPTYYNAGAGAVNVVSGQVTLTLTGLVSGSDIVIKTSDTNTALVNVDQNSGGSYGYTYTYAASTFVDIKIVKAGYVPYQVYDYLLGNGDSSLPIAQISDRNYV